MSVTPRLPRTAAWLLTAVFGASLLVLPTTQARAVDTGTVPAAAGVHFDIPSQGLQAALLEFWRQSGQELLYSDSDIAGKTSSPVSGPLSRNEALATLLRGTGLEFEVTPSGGIMVGDRATLDAQRFVQPGAAASESRYSGIEEVIVTGQKREERMQDVPIAISSFSMENLDQQKIEGGFDLLKAIPNVVFSKTNFSGYNFQIRGIGTQAVSATTDPGVAMSMNNTTLITNRLFEQEYLDIERVEVLRGPQGTLYGRNATAGVINVISSKPQMGVYSGEVKLETGNYNARRMRGHFNFPIRNPLTGNETLAARVAYASTQRDGYGTNLAAGEDFVGREAPSSKNLDNRDLYTARFSLGWQLTDRFRANFIFERFKEDDNRLRVAKQLCHTDPGVTKVDGWRLSEYPDEGGANANRHPRSREFIAQTSMSQGCLPRSLFAKGDPANPDDHGAYGTPNGQRIPFTSAARLTAFNIGGSGGPSVPLAQYPDVFGCTAGSNYFVTSGFLNPCVTDPLAGGGQSHDLRAIYSPITPEYRAQSSYYELSMDYELGDGLTLSSQTVYMDNDQFSTQDFLRFETSPNLFQNSLFNCTGSLDPEALCTPTTLLTGGQTPFLNNNMPGGIFCDPQLGCSDRLMIQDVSQQHTQQLSTELRLASSFNGRLNFSLGLNYTGFKNTADYFVFSNALTALATTGSVFSGGIGAGIVPPSGFFPGVMSLSSPTIDAVNVYRQYRGSDLAKVERVYVQREGLHATVDNPQGHNFFMSRNPFSLESSGLFGEVYYHLTPSVKFTVGLRFNWDRKVFTPTPSQTLLGDARIFEGMSYQDGDGITRPVDLSNSDSLRDFCLTADVFRRTVCGTSGMAVQGRGYPVMPDIVQEWYVPTGRIGIDWQANPGLDWLDETLLYAFYTRGYKAGGANPPLQGFPSGVMLEVAQGAVTRPIFDAEYVNAFEIGIKNTLFNNALMLNASAFFYDYQDYQVSKIIDRSAQNENFDATIWGLELEALFAPTMNTLLNASIGYLRTRIADGEQSIDLMDRTQYHTQGVHQVFRSTMGNPDYDAGWVPGVDGEPGLNTPDQAFLAFDEWVVIRPALSQASSCVAPAALIREHLSEGNGSTGIITAEPLSYFCPAGTTAQGLLYPGYEPMLDAPNGGAGFFADLGGHELPNAPRFTVSLGAQHTRQLSINWTATSRVDWYWQDKSYHRVFNTEYDRLRDWTNTNLSLWFTNERHRLTFELYVKNVFDETPVTGAFLNSDDTGLSTNVFTLDPRLVGLSVRKKF